jgi:hypothetical protein
MCESKVIRAIKTNIQKRNDSYTSQHQFWMEEAPLVYMTQYLFVLLLRKEGRQYGIMKTNKGLRTLHRTLQNGNGTDRIIG